MKRRTLITSAGAAAGLTYLPALAQEKFPSKPIEVVTHSGAGGGTDITARMMLVPSGTVTSNLEDFARGNPLAAMGAAVLVGVVLGLWRGRQA